MLFGNQQLALAEQNPLRSIVKGKKRFASLVEKVRHAKKKVRDLDSKEKNRLKRRGIIEMSKIAESRVFVKQLEYEIERLESMQPNAFDAVRFHRLVPWRKSFSFTEMAGRGQACLVDGARVRAQVFRINLLTSAHLKRAACTSWFDRQ